MILIVLRRITPPADLMRRLASVATTVGNIMARMEIMNGGFDH